MIHLHVALRWAWCGAIVAALGCSHDYTTLTSGRGGSGSPGVGGSGVGGLLGSGSGGAIGPGGAGAVGAGGAAGAGGAVGAGGTIGPGGQNGTGGAAGAPTGTGGAGAGGQTGRGGSGGGAGQPGTGGGAGACQLPSLTFKPRPPSVLIFTDRGGSSFDTPATTGSLPTTGSFFNVRTAIENIITSAQYNFRFGLGVYVGDHTSGSCQLGYVTAPMALTNAAALGAVYDSLGPLAGKADTPATAALAMAKAALLADTGGGSKFLLFITSGATDFCDDGAADCPTDAVTSQLQAMYAGTPNIETLVLGLTTKSTGLTPGALATFANAGAGQPTAVASSVGGTPSSIYNECHLDSQQWDTLFTASGKTPPAAIGSYSATAGTAPLFMAATNSVSDIETQLQAALAAAKSCAFDLSAHSIYSNKVAEGTVTVGGVNVPQDGSNGWSMPSTTALVLNGSACRSYWQPGATISINFPCDAILP